MCPAVREELSKRGHTLTKGPNGTNVVHQLAPAAFAAFGTLERLNRATIEASGTNNSCGLLCYLGQVAAIKPSCATTSRSRILCITAQAK